MRKRPTEKKSKQRKPVNSEINHDDISDPERLALNADKLKREADNLQGILADKEVYIDNLIGRIGALERMIVDKDIHINQSEKHIRDITQEITERDQTIRQYQEEKLALETEVGRLENIIFIILNSSAWKLTGPFRKFKDMLTYKN